ncbi:addiction module killer protein [candidate division TM6 bacterium RIFCSPHIGHO2_12_FULL_32_22]|nr:MAG: addiction module killer protein [candidate division TM6 bacterium RIFCSPHIGHO2_12_FULL_32_22]
MIEIKIYKTKTEKSPFIIWRDNLDSKARGVVRTRLERVRLGNFGDVKSLKDGVYELRIDFGSGYRIYFGKQGRSIIILLVGGDKRSQKRDIEKAKEYWQNCKDKNE